MASFTGLANDVAISYAHADNTEEWVDRFHERLLNKLKQLDRNAAFTIWRDRKLTGSDVFSDEIFKQFESSGILIRFFPAKTGMQARGKTLASASADQTWLWDVSLESWIRRACAGANRNLSLAEWRQYVGKEETYEKTCPDLPAGEGAPGK